MSIRNDIAIDRYNLADLLESHPERFHEWGEKYVAATEARDHAKNKLDLIKADAKEVIERERGRVDLAVRATPEKYGLTKPTEASIASAIASDKGFQKVQAEWRDRLVTASEALLKAQNDVDVLALAKETLKQRKECMDNLVRLHNDGYWSVKVPRDVQKQLEKEERVEKNEEAKEALNDKMKVRRRLAGNGCQ